MRSREDRLVELWDDPDVSYRDICRILEASSDWVHQTKRRLGLGRRRCHWERLSEEAVLSRCPAPDEIAEATARIRSQWTPEEEEKRIVGVSSGSWRPPLFSLNVH